MRSIAWVAVLAACGGKDGKDAVGDDDDDTVGDDDDTVTTETTGDDDDDTVPPPGELSDGPVCTEGGWCWETPLPAGGPVGGLWAVGPDDVWSTSQTHLFHLGADGVRSAAFPTLVPYVNPSPVFGVASDDVWAHGFGAFVHWDGVRWTAAPATGTYAAAIHGVAADDLWAVGFSTIYRGDGAAWTVLRTDAGTSYTDVWAVGPDEAVVAGYDGSGGVWSASGGGLTDLGFPGSTYRIVIGLYASAADDVWAVGGDGAWHLSGGTWTQRSTDWGMVDVWGSGPDDVWLLSQAGRAVHHWDGSALTPEVLPEGVLASKISGAGGEVFVGDSSGAIFVRRASGAWESVKAPLSVGTVVDLVADGAGGVFAAAGEDVLTADPAGDWSVVEGPGGLVTGLGEADGEVLAFTSSGAWRWDGADWQITLDGAGLVDACTLADGTVLGVGAEVGTFDGIRWDREALPVDPPVARVLCAGDEAFATSVETFRVGEEPSTLLRHDGAGWRRVGLRTAIGRTLTSTFAPAPDQALVVVTGDTPGDGVLLRFDGTAWEEVPLPFAPGGVGGAGRGDAWVVGANGVARVDAAGGVTEITDAPFGDFRWVRSDGGGRATVVASDGAVWAYDPGAVPTWTEVLAGGDVTLDDAAFTQDEVFGIATLWDPVRLGPTGWERLSGGSYEQVEATEDAGAWFVDVGGRLGEWDGGTQIVTDWSNNDVPGILVLPTTGPDLVAVSYDGEVSVRSGSTWVVESAVSLRSPTLAFGTSLDDLWVIGEDDDTRTMQIDRRDAGSWDRWSEILQPVGFGIAPSGDEIWVDATHAIWRRSGAGFEELFPPSDIGASYAATGAVVRDYDDVWVAALGGVLHFDGAWATLADPLGLGFYGMTSTPDGTGWALGQSGWVASLEP